MRRGRGAKTRLFRLNFTYSWLPDHRLIGMGWEGMSIFPMGSALYGKKDGESNGNGDVG